MSAPISSSRSAIKTRVLACTSCQQRKIKCDRRFPCVHCVKSGTRCVPAALEPRQRRRRFPERDLLERLRQYEGLLRQNKIKFEPLHPGTVDKTSTNVDSKECDSEDETLGGNGTAGAEKPLKEEVSEPVFEPVYEAKNIWRAMNQKSQHPTSPTGDDAVGNDDDGYSSPDEVGEIVVKNALDLMYGDKYERNDIFLFGSPRAGIDISTMHPQQVDIFRLWQIYVDNVNPLLKVTHTPTLQARIINAASDVANISPPLEALMFSIYCMAVLSLDNEECLSFFSLSKDGLMANYHFACQQALVNCGVLRTRDRDSLTALHLYLMSLVPDKEPQSVSSMLGVAIRVAQRMGIQSESANAKCTPFEAEMRRRLWWSLVIFDARICEMSDQKATILNPTWDCRTPANLNDFDLRPELSAQPTPQSNPTEAIFAVVRSEIYDFLRHSALHLDFSNPFFMSIARATKQRDVAALERMVEEKYLQYCNPENPLHSMTIWSLRGQLARMRLLEYYSKFSTASAQPTDVDRDMSITYAIKLLNCDGKLMSSALVKPYKWLPETFYFPFPAYIHIVTDMRKRQNHQHTEKCWNAMNENYAARNMGVDPEANPFHLIFGKILLQTWDAQAARFAEEETEFRIPQIVVETRAVLGQMASKENSTPGATGSDFQDIGMDEFSMPMPLDFDNGDRGGGMSFGMGDQAQGYAGWNAGGYGGIVQPSAGDVDMSQLDWSAIDFTSTFNKSW